MGEKIASGWDRWTDRHREPAGRTSSDLPRGSGFWHRLKKTSGRVGLLMATVFSAAPGE